MSTVSTVFRASLGPGVAGREKSQMRTSSCSSCPPGAAAFPNGKLEFLHQLMRGVRPPRVHPLQQCHFPNAGLFGPSPDPGAACHSTTAPRSRGAS